MQKDLEHYYKSTTKGSRNAERARKFCSKSTNERIIVSCSPVHGKTSSIGTCIFLYFTNNYQTKGVFLWGDLDQDSDPRSLRSWYMYIKEFNESVTRVD